MSASVTTVAAAQCAFGIMANQLYAVPIIIEAFQTGKGAMRVDDEIQALNGAATSPNNGPFIGFSPSSATRLDKGIIQIAAWMPEMRNFLPAIFGFSQFLLGARNPTTGIRE